MDAETDNALLARYASSRDEAAFAVLVDRYTALVYHTALRRGAAPHLAQEIAQDTFAALACKAHTLTGHPSIPGWLHTSTLNFTKNAMRKEQRHADKIGKLAAQANPEPPSEWDGALPELDTAIASLKPGDRHAILARYVSGQTTREIASQNNKTEAATQKQITRALGKLADALRARGVTLTTTALAAGLANKLSAPVPETVTASVLKAALAAGAAPATVATTTATTTLLTMASSKITAAALVVLGAAVPITVQQLTPPPSPSIPSPHGTTPAEVPQPAPDPTSGPAPQNSLASLVQAIRWFASDASNDSDPLGARRRSNELQLRIFELPDDQLPQLANHLLQTPYVSSLYHITSAAFSRWAEFDPESAFANATAVPSHSTAARHGTLTTWALDNPDAAIAATLGQAKPDNLYSDLHDIFSALIERSPEAAMATVLDLDLSSQDKGEELEEQIVESAITHWTAHDPEAAFAWANDLQDTAQRRKLTKEIVAGLALSRPDRSVELALRFDRHQDREEGARWALMQWAADDPQATADAYIALPDDVRTENLTYNITPFLSGADPDTALYVANQLPVGKNQNHFLYAAAVEKAKASPADAAVIAALLQDKKQRERAMEKVARSWLEKDRPAALTWFETESPLPEKKLAEVLADSQ